LVACELDMDLRGAFREAIESDGIVVAPGVYDGISAKVVEEAGFEAAFISGAAVSNSRLGKPDFGILNLTENADQARTIAEAVDIPVQVDADTGYGNAVHVHHTIETLEDTGVASVMIEDQQSPKRCGHMQGKSVIPQRDMVRKVEAAVDARSDPNFLIKARTDAAGPHDIEEAVERLNAYTDAGADLLFADALLSEEDFEYVAEHTNAPLSVNMGYGIRERPTTPLMSPATLEDLGVDLVIYPRLITGAAVKGMKNALETLEESLKTEEVIKRPDQTLSFEEYTDLMDLPEIRDLEERFADN
jgi:2-methylisocitrate lyase-like PEP mutase family enzyme